MRNVKVKTKDALKVHTPEGNGTHQTFTKIACPDSSTSLRQFRELSMTTLEENWPPATPERDATRLSRARPIILTAVIVVELP